MGSLKDDIVYSGVCVGDFGRIVEGIDMIRGCGRVIGLMGVVCFVAAVAVLLFADGGFAQGRRVSLGASGITVGEAAPDFELPMLIMTRDADGNPIGKISEEKIRLSSFQGKKPVCMIMSSYT